MFTEFFKDHFKQGLCHTLPHIATQKQIHVAKMCQSKLSISEAQMGEKVLKIFQKYFSIDPKSFDCDMSDGIRFFVTRFTRL